MWKKMLRLGGWRRSARNVNAKMPRSRNRCEGICAGRKCAGALSSQQDRMRRTSRPAIQAGQSWSSASVISVINLAEVLYILARYSGQEQAREAIGRCTTACVSLRCRERSRALATANLRIRYKLGFADCFAAELGDAHRSHAGHRRPGVRQARQAIEGTGPAAPFRIMRSKANPSAQTVAYSPSSRTTWFTIIRSSAGGITRTVTGEFSAEIVACAAHVVALRIEHDAQRSQPRADLRARGDVVFADAAGEDQHVQPAQLGHIAADPLGDGPGEFVHGQPRLGVAVLDGVAQIAHVVRELAHAQQAGLLADRRSPACRPRPRRCSARSRQSCAE